MKKNIIVILILTALFSNVKCFAQLQSDTSDHVWSIVLPLAQANDIDMHQCLLGSVKDSVINDFISNAGTYQFRVDSIYFTGADAGCFKLVSGLPKYEVAAGGNKTSEICFIPNRIGEHFATINIITQSDTLVQSIKGEGVQLQLQIMTTLLDFGQVPIGSDSTISDTALIKNVSGFDLPISNVVMLGTDKTQFEIISGGGSFNLVSGETHKLTIRFKPVYGGRSSGQVGFEYNGVGSPAKARLFGTGIGGLVYFMDDSAYAGERRNLKLMLSKVKPEGISSIAPNYEAKIRFQKTILAPQNSSNWNIVHDSIVMTLKGSIGSTNVLAQIPVRAGLGNVEETSLDILDFKLEDNSGNPVDYNFDTQSGTFKLLGICNEGGARLVNVDSQKVDILGIIPNPVQDEATINYYLIEDGFTKLALYNSLGKEVKIIFNGYPLTGLQSITIDIKDLNSGVYFILLKTPTEIVNKTLVISK